MYEQIPDLRSKLLCIPGKLISDMWMLLLRFSSGSHKGQGVETLANSQIYI